MSAAAVARRQKKKPHRQAQTQVPAPEPQQPPSPEAQIDFELDFELRLLQRLLYKNRLQHRRGVYYRRVCDVYRRCGHLQPFVGGTQAGLEDGVSPVPADWIHSEITALLGLELDARVDLPLGQAAGQALAACLGLQRAILASRACYAACDSLLGMLARTFDMRLAAVMLGGVARLARLARGLALGLNQTLQEALPRLFRPASMTGGSASTHDSSWNSLGQVLELLGGWQRVMGFAERLAWTSAALPSSASSASASGGSTIIPPSPAAPGATPGTLALKSVLGLAATSASVSGGGVAGGAPSPAEAKQRRREQLARWLGHVPNQLLLPQTQWGGGGSSQASSPSAQAQAKQLQEDLVAQQHQLYPTSAWERRLADGPELLELLQQVGAALVVRCCVEATGCASSAAAVGPAADELRVPIPRRLGPLLREMEVQAAEQPWLRELLLPAGAGAAADHSQGSALDRGLADSQHQLKLQASWAASELQGAVVSSDDDDEDDEDNDIANAITARDDMMFLQTPPPRRPLSHRSRVAHELRPRDKAATSGILGVDADADRDDYDGGADTVDVEDPDEDEDHDDDGGNDGDVGDDDDDFISLVPVAAKRPAAPAVASASRSSKPGSKKIAKTSPSSQSQKTSGSNDSKNQAAEAAIPVGSKRKRPESHLPNQPDQLDQPKQLKQPKQPKQAKQPSSRPDVPPVPVLDAPVSVPTAASAGSSAYADAPAAEFSAPPPKKAKLKHNASASGKASKLKPPQPSSSSSSLQPSEAAPGPSKAKVEAKSAKKTSKELDDKPALKAAKAKTKSAAAAALTGPQALPKQQSTKPDKTKNKDSSVKANSKKLTKTKPKKAGQKSASPQPDLGERDEIDDLFGF